jgi:hypothetical protein
MTAEKENTLLIGHAGQRGRRGRHEGMLPSPYNGVIPAKAGIPLSLHRHGEEAGSRFRRDDGVKG